MLDKVILIVILCVLTYLFTKILSSEPNYIQFKFKFFVLYCLSSTLAVVIWPYFLLSPKNVRNLKVSAEILKHMTKLYDIKWILRNGEILSEERGAVVVANHQSILDILGMFNVWAVANKLTAVARKEVFYVWPFGLAAYFAGLVFIDRKTPKDAYKQLNALSKVMVKNKTKIWLFPEGTRNKDPSNLLPFKKGAFFTALNAQVPIIPVVFSPYYFMDRKKYIFNGGHVIIQCLEPEPTEGLTMEDIPALIQRVRTKMETAYAELSKEVLSASSSEKSNTTTQKDN